MSAPTLESAAVGDRIRFAGDRMFFTIQARDARFIVCTRPFALKKTVLYTVVDLVEQVRGADNHYSLGYETREDCERALRKFSASVRWARMVERREPGVRCSPVVEVSHRNRVPLEVDRITSAPAKKSGAHTGDGVRP